MDSQSWHTSLAEVCFGFAVVVLIYCIYLCFSRKRGASRRGLPKPSDKCQRNRPGAVP